MIHFDNSRHLKRVFPFNLITLKLKSISFFCERTVHSLLLFLPAVWKLVFYFCSTYCWVDYNQTHLQPSNFGNHPSSYIFCMITFSRDKKINRALYSLILFSLQWLRWSCTFQFDFVTQYFPIITSYLCHNYFLKGASSSLNREEKKM